MADFGISSCLTPCAGVYLPLRVRDGGGGPYAVRIQKASVFRILFMKIMITLLIEQIA